MARITKYAHGTPSWVDLGAPDVDAAADCDASVAKIEALSGAIVMPAMTIPIGRFAVATDRGGATFAIIQMTS